MEHIPTRDFVYARSRRVSVFSKSLKDFDFLVSYWLEEPDQIVLCRSFPSSLYDKDSTLKVIDTEIPCRTLNGLSVLTQPSSYRCALFSRGAGVKSLGRSLTDIDRRFGTTYC